MSHHLASPLARTLAAATVFGDIILTCSSMASFAQAPDTGTAPPATAPPLPLDEGGPPETPVDPIAARIKYLHDRLRITPAQEPLWANVAQAMRENATALAPFLRARLQSAQSGNAIDVLGSYEKLGEAQLAGLKRFTAAFQTLYPALSNEQKKIADTIFRVGPLGMVGGIPRLAEDLVAPPPSVYAPSYTAAPPVPAYMPPTYYYPYYPPYAYYPAYAYPYYPYYRPWIWGPPFGFGASFFFVHRFHHHRHVHPIVPHAFVGVPHAGVGPHAFIGVPHVGVGPHAFIVPHAGVGPHAFGVPHAGVGVLHRR